MPSEERQFWYALTLIGSGLVMIDTATQNALGIVLTIIGGLWLLYLERERILRRFVPLYRRYGFRYPMASLIIVTAIGALLGALIAGGGWLALHHFAVDPNPRRTSADPNLQGTMGSIVKPSETTTELFLEVTLWNRGGSPSIAKNWQLYATCGERKIVILGAHAPSEANFLADSTGEGLLPREGIQPGGEGHYRFKYILPFSAEEIKHNEFVYDLVVYDVHNRASTIKGQLRSS
jgi:hypothetical protein